MQGIIQPQNGKSADKTFARFSNLEIVEIGGLPLYNQDLEDNPPTAWIEFRARLKKFDGVLFVTDEYNRSVPGGLKNAIDVGSRPMEKVHGRGNRAQWSASHLALSADLGQTTT